MISKEHFEAHVRAEAEVKVPVVRLAHPTLKHHSFDLGEGPRKLYISARMEHEWPLVEAIQKNTMIEADCSCCQWAREVLSPYTNPDTQTT